MSANTEDTRGIFEDVGKPVAICDKCGALANERQKAEMVHEDCPEECV